MSDRNSDRDATDSDDGTEQPADSERPADTARGEDSERAADTASADESDGGAATDGTDEPARAGAPERTDAPTGTDEIPFDEPEDAPFDGTDEELFRELDALGDADPFTEMTADAEAVGDEVFDMVGADETQPVDLNLERDPGVEEVEEGVVIPKLSYCERCPHFSEPPTVACTNPGTTIHELVDVDHFRVSNCPIVAEQRDVRAPGE